MTWPGRGTNAGFSAFVTCCMFGFEEDSRPETTRPTLYVACTTSSRSRKSSHECRYSSSFVAARWSRMSWAVAEPSRAWRSRTAFDHWAFPLAVMAATCRCPASTALSASSLNHFDVAAVVTPVLDDADGGRS